MTQKLQEKVLGFDPYSKEKRSFIIKLTPEQAQYILDYHNGDNRKLTKSQVNAIVKSIYKDGWLFDGQPLTFNIEGNITEFQHRLHAIVETGVTAEVSVTLGVDTGCFTKCAPAKPRRAEDEIQRKDKTAKASETSTLRQVLIRRQGDKLTIQNAIEKWNYWKDYVRAGDKLTDEFFDKVAEHKSWARTYSAWAAMLIYVGEEQIASDFMSLIQEEFLGDDTCCLTREFREFFKINSEMSGSERTAMLWKLLCICADRLKKQPNGNIQLGINNPAELGDKKLSQKGFYRRFLYNPQNILLVGQLP
tara:strand:+ start:1206 stop:2120 length:915 start_codon:yes stop_codon:yes gene_type:complete